MANLNDWASDNDKGGANGGRAPLPPPPRSGSLPPPPPRPSALPPPPSAATPTPSALPPPPSARAAGVGTSWPAWGEEEEDVRKPLPKTPTSSQSRPAARGGPPGGAAPSWPSWAEEEDEGPARPSARGKSSGWGESEAKSPGRGSSSSMPAWAADQPEAQEGWLTSTPTEAPKGGLPPVAPSSESSSPAEATSSAAVWESDGLMGPATIPVDDSDPLPSMRPSDAHNKKMLMIAVGLLLLVVAGLGFMLTRPAAKPVAVATADVMQPSELMDKARGLAEKKNYKGASLEAEAAATMLEQSLKEDPTNAELKKQWIQAKELLASMYLKSEQFDRAYKTYKELHNLTGVKKYAASAQEAEKQRLKAIRAEGQEKLDLAKQMLKSNNPAGAIMEGLHAEQLFTDGKATNAQKAAVCYTLGRAFEAQQQDERAQDYYKKAVSLAYSGEYAAALSRVRSRTAPVVVSAPQVQEVEVVNSVPQGPRNVRRVVRRPAPAPPRVVAQPPPPKRPTVAAPPMNRRPPKSSGPPKFSSDNDPSKFKYY